MPTINVDAIYCLTLPNRETRISAVELEFQKIGIADTVQFLVANKLAETAPGGAANPIKAGDLGCASSHRQAVEHANRLGYDRILVFEDDVVVSPHFDVCKLNDLIDEFEEVDGEVLNLGGCSPDWRPGAPNLLSKRVSSGLFEVVNMVSTHAIIYSKRVFDRILLQIPTYEELLTLFTNTIMVGAFDQWLSSEPNHTGEYPLFYQDVRTTSSDILGMPHSVDLITLIEKTYEILRAKA